MDGGGTQKTSHFTANYLLLIYSGREEVPAFSCIPVVTLLGSILILSLIALINLSKPNVRDLENRLPEMSQGIGMGYGLIEMIGIEKR